MPYFLPVTLTVTSIFTGYAFWWMLADVTPGGDTPSSPTGSSSANFSHTPVVKVGESIITMAHIDFEHHLLTQVLAENPETLQEDPHFPGPQNSLPPFVLAELPAAKTSLPQNSWSSLRMFVLRSIIKRKLLFHMAQNDPLFDLKDPHIYRTCRDRWQQLLADAHPFLDSQQHSKMLEARECERYVIEYYIKSRVIHNVEVKEREAEEYYQRHRVEFVTPQRITVRHIQFADEASARKIHPKLKPHNFAKLAAEHSIAPEASQGGLLEPYAAHEVPAFLAEVFRLKIKRISSIVRSSYGYHVFLPLKKTGGGIMSYPEAQPQIMAFLKHQKQQQLKSEWFAQALNTVAVEGQSYLKKGGPL